MYVTAAFSVQSSRDYVVAMASSRWDSHKDDRDERTWKDWSSCNWTAESAQSWTQTVSAPPSGNSSSSRSGSPSYVDVISRDAPQFGTSNSSWVPSLSVKYEPLNLQENRKYSRSSKVPDTIVPVWLKNQHWQDRVNEMCNKPNKTTVSLKSAQPFGIYQIDYGKQTGCTRTPLTYGPGEGSRLDKYVDCYYEQYEFAAWEANFVFQGKTFELPTNNLELEQWAVKHARLENLVELRHRSASRELTTKEKVPNETSATVLNN